MKLAIFLIVLGGLLLAEGGSRILMGFIVGRFELIFGGILTGIILGGVLLYLGIRRLLKYKVK